MIKRVASDRQAPTFDGVCKDNTWFVCDEVALAICIEQHFNVVAAEVLHQWR